MINIKLGKVRAHDGSTRAHATITHSFAVNPFLWSILDGENAPLQPNNTDMTVRMHKGQPTEALWEQVSNKRGTHWTQDTRAGHGEVTRDTRMQSLYGHEKI